MKITEIREKTISELKDLLKNLYKEQFNFRFIKAGKEVVKPNKVRAARLAIARVKTILKEKNNRGAENS